MQRLLTFALVLTSLTACSDPPGPAASAPGAPAPPPEVVVETEPTPAPAPAPSVQTTWDALLSVDGQPLADVTVSVTTFIQVQCVTAPCNPQQAGGHTLTTDAQGLIRIPPAKGDMIGGADYALVSAAGHQPVRMELPSQPPAQPVRLQLSKAK